MIEALWMPSQKNATTTKISANWHPTWKNRSRPYPRKRLPLRRKRRKKRRGSSTGKRRFSVSLAAKSDGGLVYDSEMMI
jgi:hypothetical protein